jgi:hypothetical protein
MLFDPEGRPPSSGYAARGEPSFITFRRSRQTRSRRDHCFAAEAATRGGDVALLQQASTGSADLVRGVIATLRGSIAEIVVTHGVREEPRRRAGRRDWFIAERATGRSASRAPGLVKACRLCLCRASDPATDAVLSRFVRSGHLDRDYRGAWSLRSGSTAGVLAGARRLLLGLATRAAPAGLRLQWRRG